MEVLRTQIAEQEKRALELQLETLKAQVAELQAQRDKVSKPKKRIRKRKAAVKYEDDDSDAYVPSRPRPPPSQPTRSTDVSAAFAYLFIQNGEPANEPVSLLKWNQMFLPLLKNVLKSLIT